MNIMRYIFRIEYDLKSNYNSIERIIVFNIFTITKPYLTQRSFSNGMVK